MKVASFFAFQPELFFSSKGQKFEHNGSTLIYKLNYLELPVLFKLLIPTGGIVTPTVYVGPSFALKLGKIDGTMKNDGDKEDMPEDVRDEMDKSVNKFDFGLAMGGGLGINAGPGIIVLDVRYTLGLTKVNKLTDDMKSEGLTEDNLSKNSTLSLSLGYLFNF